MEKNLHFMMCVQVPLPARAEVRGYVRQARELLEGDHRDAVVVVAESVARKAAVARSLLRLQTRMREALRRRLYLRHVEFDAW